MINIWREERKDAVTPRYEKAVGTFGTIPLCSEWRVLDLLATIGDNGRSKRAATKGSLLSHYSLPSSLYKAEEEGLSG
jgi:hypothetical protein